MPRQSFLLALGFIALVGLVSAANTSSKPPSAVPATDDDTIGNTDAGGAASPGASDDAVAGPLGSEQEAKNMAPAPSSDATTTGASTIGATALTGAAAIATCFVF